MLLPPCDYIIPGSHGVRGQHISIAAHSGTATCSLVFAPGSMADFPGYSLSGAVAAAFFILLAMKQSGRVPSPAPHYTRMSWRPGLGAEV